LPAYRAVVAEPPTFASACQVSRASEDTFWHSIRTDAEAMARTEPVLRKLIADQILDHAGFGSAVVHVVCQRLSGGALDERTLRTTADGAIRADREILAALREDIEAACRRDPATTGPAEPLLFYKGFHALAIYRISHWLWLQGRRPLARCLQSRCSERLAVDIHPAARIGRGILLDHGTGVVIGETAVIEDHVSILHNVTLGGTGKASGDRHPKIRSGVLIGAGALILGNVEIGRGAKVCAGSVVLGAVQPHTTVAGHLARRVGVPGTSQPSLEMTHVEPSTPEVSSRVPDRNEPAGSIEADAARQ
jgi:serine O-acetyltransferase